MFASLHAATIKQFWVRKPGANAAPAGGRVSGHSAGLDGTEAALRRIDVEAPGWTLRRLQWDGGVWCCKLSLFRGMPPEFDDAVEGIDRSLAGAILNAVEQARHQPTWRVTVPARALPPTLPAEQAWCDNTY